MKIPIAIILMASSIAIAQPAPNDEMIVTPQIDGSMCYHAPGTTCQSLGYQDLSQICQPTEPKTGPDITVTPMSDRIDLVLDDKWRIPAVMGIMFDVLLKGPSGYEPAVETCKAEWTPTGLRLWCDSSGKTDITFLPQEPARGNDRQ